ncbi:MAG TPA: RNA-dependent DNA polymerase [Chloroflexi bacterium]|nr:RNA-dependent DNA polymerase [Chloroflexota bacterium]
MTKTYSPGPLMKQICAIPNLVAAWRAVRGNITVNRRPHSCGVDEVSVAAFEQQWEENLAELSRSMLEGRYRPLPPRRVEVRKPGGGKRAIGVLAVRDRVAQRAAHQVLDPLFDEQFLDCSYGFRTGRSVEDAVHRVQCYRQAGCAWVVHADVIACFDTLDHKLLMRFVAETVRERGVLQLIEGWLEAGVLETDAEVYRVPGAWERLLNSATGRLRSSAPFSRWPDEEGESIRDLVPDGGWQRRELAKQLGTDALLAGLTVARPTMEKVLPGLHRLVRRRRVIWGAAGLVGVGALASAWLLLRWLAPRPHGALQGGALSPLLANVYLHQFDRAVTDAGENLVRFADDFVICCPERGAAERAGELAARELADLRLRLNQAKSHVVSFDQGFRFLGRRFK